MSGDDTDRVNFAYGPNYTRLVEIERRYDPSSTFRHNQHIRP